MGTLGRPSSYAPDIAEKICELIAEGHSLVSICRDNEGMPNRVTVARWLAKHEDFRIMYAHAREEQADAFFDEIREVADQEPATSRTYDEAGNVTSERVDSGEVQHRRLKVDALKWMASKLRPKKYGELTQLHGDVVHKHYVAVIPGRTTNDPAEWAKQVQAERVASGELPAPEPEDEPEDDAPPPGLPQR